MELRRSFNEDEVNYDRVRPEYPQALFDDVSAYACIGPGSRLLEIGIGTGQATRPFLELGCDVLAVELGDRLSAFVAEKYRAYPNFRVVNDDFMTHPVEEGAYDLIFSATAFHWLPQAEAYQRVMASLKPGGALALFWNHPFPNRGDDPTNMASKAVYDTFRPSGRKQVEFSEADCAPRVEALRTAGFAAVESRLYRRVRTLTTEQYLQLLNTYSDHRALESAVKTAFEDAMARAIDGVGGVIHIYDTLDLYMAKKP